MAVEPTRYSRVSVGFRDSKRSLADLDPADTGRDFSCINGASTGSFAVAGAFSSGAFAATTGTFSSTLTVGGNLTATAGAFIGNAAAVNEIVAFSSATAAISFGAIAALGTSSLKTVGLSGATRGDSIWVTPDSIWQDTADNQLISVYASSSSTAGEINVWAINSGQSSITPTAGSVFRLTRINHPTYL